MRKKYNLLYFIFHMLLESHYEFLMESLIKHCPHFSSHRLPQLTGAIELVNEISRQLTDRKNEAVTEISNTFEELEKALHQRKTALITDLENICTTKQKVRQLHT